jgi:hypothetical protein
MKKPIKVLTAACALIAAPAVLADHYMETYRCELKDGKEMEAVKEVNQKWLKMVQDKVSKDIDSKMGTAVVGDQTIFLFADSYPNLATWAATKDALDSDDGSDLDEMFDDLMECEQNRLWKFEDM